MKSDRSINLIVTLDRALRIIERILVTTSFVLVLCTAGYLSIHAFV